MPEVLTEIKPLNVIFERGMARQQLAAERSRLEREVIEAAKAEYRIEHEADHGGNTITRTEALIQMQPAIQKRREAVAALIDFEAKQK